MIELATITDLFTREQIMTPEHRAYLIQAATDKLLQAAMLREDAQQILLEAELLDSESRQLNRIANDGK